MNHCEAVDFSECHSEEVMFNLTLSIDTTMGGNPGGTGGTCPPPPTILKVGDTISNVLPTFLGLYDYSLK